MSAVEWSEEARGIAVLKGLIQGLDVLEIMRQFTCCHINNQVCVTMRIGCGGNDGWEWYGVWFIE